MTRVLVIGAGGVFGSRLAKGLVRDGFEVVVAGRSLQRAEATKAEVGAASAVVLNTRSLTAADLAATGAAIVVDAAGPFQGAEPRVARAAIAAGLHYVDLADARDFVAGFEALDEAAKTAGVTALTGASSTPALSNAVLDALTAGWTRIDAVEAAISPGGKTPRGRSVTEAILSWMGRPVRVFEGGEWTERTGWGAVTVRDFGPAGRRRLSLCETPDLDVLAERFRPTGSAVFLAGAGAGLRPLGRLGLGEVGQFDRLRPSILDRFDHFPVPARRPIRKRRRRHAGRGGRAGRGRAGGARRLAADRASGRRSGDAGYSRLGGGQGARGGASGVGRTRLCR